MSAIVVIGGAGRTGRLITGRLMARGLPVRVLSRHPRLTATGDVQQVRGDLSTLDTAVLDGAAGTIVTVEPPTDVPGAEALLHRGVAVLAAAAARTDVPVVLVSQIYVTRPDRYPQMSAVIAARARGEQALRASGARYVIVRPGWLIDGPAGKVRFEQGDRGDGSVSRENVAEAGVQALLQPAAHGRTFEIFDAQPEPSGAGTSGGTVNWTRLFGQLTTDLEATRAQ